MHCATDNQKKLLELIKIVSASNEMKTPSSVHFKQFFRVLGMKLNSGYCPSVDTGRFIEVFTENVMQSTTEDDFISTDTTLDDFAFVIEQAMSSYKCIR